MDFTTSSGSTFFPAIPALSTSESPAFSRIGKEIKADAVILDEFKARKLAKAEGIQVRGTVGILETLYRRLISPIFDLGAAFQQLLAENVYIDRRLLNRRLQSLGLPPL